MHHCPPGFFPLSDSQVLEVFHFALSLLVSTRFKVLALPDGQHPLGSAVRLDTLSLSTVITVVSAFFREMGLSAAVADLLPI